MQKNKSTDSSVKIALYNLSTHRIYRENHSNNPISEQEIPEDLLVQIEFLSGRVHYPKNQQDELRKFLGDNTRAKMLLDIFKKDILRYKKDTSKAFRNSVLEKEFINILGSVD